MTKQLSDYEIEKQKKKQELVRNEFLYQNKSAGKYEFPIIKKQNINIDKIEFLSYVNAKKMMTIEIKQFISLLMIGNLRKFTKMRKMN